MGAVDSRLASLRLLAETNGLWMAWNLVLALVPVALAFVLFTLTTRGAQPARRTPVWWVGVVLFVLFLPNAPYLVTDLVHLRADVHRIGPDGPVATTILPVYGALVVAGFLAYYLCLVQVRHYLTRAGLARYQGQVVLGLHALVAVGIFLGRWSRLNSWDAVTSPTATIDRTLGAFTWAAAPVLISVLFVVTATGHYITRAVVEAAWASGARSYRRWSAPHAA